MCIRSLRVHYLSALKWESQWLLMTQMENSKSRLLMPITVLVYIFFNIMMMMIWFVLLLIFNCSLVLAMWVW